MENFRAVNILCDVNIRPDSQQAYHGGLLSIMRCQCRFIFGLKKKKKRKERRKIPSILKSGVGVGAYG